VSNEAPRDTGVRSVERAITILDVLAVGGWRTGAEIARELHVHRSTALRLLGTLERHALVERDPRSAKYRLGRRLSQLASVATGESDLRTVARPVCEGLAGALGDTVTLDVLVGDEIVPIEQATASTSVVTVNWLGRRTPAHCTASGKVLLAFGGELLGDRFAVRRREPGADDGRARAFGRRPPPTRSKIRLRHLGAGSPGPRGCGVRRSARRRRGRPRYGRLSRPGGSRVR